MFRSARKQTFGLLAALSVMAIALSACSSSGSTKAPGGDVPVVTNAPGVTDAPAANGGGIEGATAAFSSIKSYKFSMTLAGGSYGDMLKGFGATASGGDGFTVSGTVVGANSDVSIGTLRFITVDGNDYIDIGMDGFTKTKSSGSSMAEAFSPASMFTGFASTSDYVKVGSEQKNGVQADHYQASASALAGLGGSLGVATGAVWTGDVWIAAAGGYPVSSAIFAKTTDGKVSYQMTFDVTNVNDASLKVEVPANVLAN
jgi:hypothetical protein